MTAMVVVVAEGDCSTGRPNLQSVLKSTSDERIRPGKRYASTVPKSLFFCSGKSRPVKKPEAC